ncbi:unnamed protein product, partial [Owenia fusiformis]
MFSKFLTCTCHARSQMDHWPLENILEFLPHNITRIILHNFNFGVLQNNSFKHFSRLHDVSIWMSNLTAIEEDAFQHFDNMENVSIALYGNDIKHIEPGAFRYGNSIWMLNLNYNFNMGLENAKRILNDLNGKKMDTLKMEGCGLVIDKIDGAFFKSLKTSQLETLNLVGNTIETLAPGAFEPIKLLKKLWISNFMYVSTSTFDTLQHLTEF